MKRFFATLACAGALALSAAAQTANARLFVFGDSLSDNGNLYRATNGAFPDDTVYSWGRASNGATFSERLGYELGYAPDVAFLQEPWGGFGPGQRGYNFAHFGATVLNSGARSGQRLGDQVGYFSRPDAQISGFSSTDQIIVWAGANDYLAFGSTDFNLVTRTLADHVRTLSRAGGQNILVFNQPLWGNIPIGFERGDRSALNTLMRNHNSALGTEMAGLRRDRVDAYLINVASLFTDIYVNPSVYGFNVVRPGTGTSGHCLGDGYGLDTCPRTYAFYDAVHPSDSLHAVLGAYTRSQLASVAARKREGAVISASSANTLALQAAILQGKSVTSGLALATLDLDADGVRLFALSDAGLPPGASFAETTGLFGSSTGFSLAGGEIAVNADLSVGFSVSEGLPDTAASAGFLPLEANGESAQLRHTIKGFELGFSASRARQSAVQTRLTGFAQDPVAESVLDQTDEFGIASISRPLAIGNWTFTPEVGVGRAGRYTEAVQEISPRGLVALSTGARHLESDIAVGKVSAAYAAPGADWSARVTVSAAELSDPSVSALAVLGLSTLTDARQIPFQSAEALEAGIDMPLSSRLLARVNVEAAEAQGKTLAAGRVGFTYRF